MKISAAVFFMICFFSAGHTGLNADTVNTVQFSGYNWEVKEARSPVGPGPNYFSASRRNVYVDDLGKLHLRVIPRKDRWFCSEIILEKSFGYGTYIFFSETRYDLFDPNTVAGLFTWDSSGGAYNREIDIEFSRWGKDSSAWETQYAVQPASSGNRLHRFSMNLEGAFSTHVMRWEEGKILFASFHGHPEPEQILDSLTELEAGREKEGAIREFWIFKGTPFPVPGGERVRINLYLYKGVPPASGEEQEFVLSRFLYLPPGESGEEGAS